MLLMYSAAFELPCYADSNPRPLAPEADVRLFTFHKQFQRFKYVLLFHKLITHIFMENT